VTARQAFGPRIGVLALQGDVHEHERALAAVGAQPVLVRDAATLAGVDGLVIPGGESTTISMLALRWGLMEPLRKAMAAGIPMLGTCAGMIMLADRVLDGRADQEQIGGIDMVVRRNAFGRQVDSFEADVSIPAIGEAPIRAVFIRAPWVESVGVGVSVLGQVGDGRVVAVRQGSLLATAFHPELTGDHRLHELLVEIVRAA
jgi:pyridoxal 5'-phosphate synthase pdxT subunit